MVPLDKELQWVNVKQKPLRQMIGTIKHIQAYSEPCVTLVYLELWHTQNPDIFRTRSIFRTLACSHIWYIQKPDILFRTLAYSKSETHSGSCHRFTIRQFGKEVNGYYYFHHL